MTLTCTDALKDYMNKTGKKIIVVEVATSDSSDFEVSELYLHFTDEKQALLFEKRKNFHRFTLDWGTVLLPNYRLEYESVVTFDIKKVLFLHLLKQTGISL